MAAALEHIRVLDLSRVLAGPWAGQILADLGAEVIKVERPGCGDDTRGWGPPYLKQKDGTDSDTAAYYLAANRGKKSIAIDMAQPEGAALIKKLAMQADIVIENFKTGNLAKYGLDYESLSKDHPGLIYCSITGFGQDGPLAHNAGYDFIVQGMAGLMSITGTPESGPVKVGTAVADLTTGMYGVIGILAALAHREQTGQGQHVDMALFDTQLSWLANQNLNYLVGGITPGRLGNAHPSIVPYQDFETKDGHLIIAVGNDRQFARFADLLGYPEWAEDPNFKTNAGRVRHRDLLIPLIAQLMKGRSTEEWRNALDTIRIPNGPINTIPQAFDEETAKARGMKVTMDHPVSGKVDLVANPIKLSRTPISYNQAPPGLGEQSDEILASIGLGVADIAELRRKAVIG
ncbi:MAG: CaiB/BaiF CoA-transferase family protein [Sphingomonadales bacterium]|jgi:crotonobetainyl-CoA:carnitine CoA-transferase CaiB-like acyl-CoA transferase